MTARSSALFHTVQLAWEFVRFFGLFALLLLRFSPALIDDPVAILWLVALGSTQLLVPAGLLFLILDAGKRPILAPFVRLGKILQLFPAVLLLFALPLSRGLPHLHLVVLPPRLSSLPFLLAGVLVDLIFLLFLFAAPPRSASPPAPLEPPGKPPQPPAQEPEEAP